MNPTNSSNWPISSYASSVATFARQAPSYERTEHTKITIAGQVVFDSQSKTQSSRPLPLNTGSSAHVTLTINGKVIVDNKPQVPTPLSMPSKATGARSQWMEEC